MRLLRAVLVLLALATVGAGFLFSGSESDAGESTSSRRQRAFIRVTHLSPDSPAFDFCRNGKIFKRNLRYTRSSGYKRVEASQDSTFDRAFAGHGCSEDLRINRAVFPAAALQNGARVSAYAIASFYEGFPKSSLIGPPALILADSTERPDRGTTNVRFVNVAINGADSVNFVADGEVIQGGVEAIRENTVLIGPKAVPIPYVNVESGRAMLEVRDSDTNELLTSKRVSARSRGSATVFLIGNASGDPGLAIFVARNG